MPPALRASRARKPPLWRRAFWFAVRLTAAALIMWMLFAVVMSLLTYATSLTSAQGQ